MQIKIVIEPVKNNSVTLSVHHNDILQGFIYRNLSKTIARSVHNSGYRLGKRAFRLFTFSRLYGKFQRSNNELIYNGKCSLWVASPVTEILESFASSLARKGIITLGKNACQITAIEVPFQGEYPSEILVRTLSPITVYSTLYDSNKRKKTYYYTPFEKEFPELIKANLIKKFKVLNSESPVPEKFEIKPEKVSNQNHHIVFYKKTVVKAWSGIYRLSGSPELIKIAFDCGLGAKNSQGFGMIEKWEKR